MLPQTALAPISSILRDRRFALVFARGVGLQMGLSFMPASIGRRVVHKAEMLERQTGLTFIILTGLILYWLARLLFLNSALAQLIRE